MINTFFEFDLNGNVANCISCNFYLNLTISSCFVCSLCREINLYSCWPATEQKVHVRKESEFLSIVLPSCLGQCRFEGFAQLMLFCPLVKYILQKLLHILLKARIEEYGVIWRHCFRRMQRSQAPLVFLIYLARLSSQYVPMSWLDCLHHGTVGRQR